MKFLIIDSNIEGFTLTAVKNNKPIKTVDFYIPIPDEGPGKWNKLAESLSHSMLKEVSFEEAKKIATDFSEFKLFEDKNPQEIYITNSGRKIKTLSHLHNYEKMYS